MDIFEKTYDRACCELDDLLQHQNLDKQDVELMGEFVDIIKDIEEISKPYNMDYSQMSDGMRGRSGRMYNRGSYMMGRSGYSRDESKQMMLEHLAQVMDMAVDEKDRKAVERLMSQMESN